MSLLRNVFRRKRLLAPIAFVVVALLLIWFLAPSEPTYQGKSTSEWLDILDRWDTTPSDRNNARQVIRQIGTNAVPVLLKKLVVEDNNRPAVATAWNGLARFLSLTSKLQIKIPDPYWEHQEALDGFVIIGTNGSSAIPRLKNLLLQRRFSNNATRCLVYIHTPEVLSALAPGLTNADPNIRLNSISGMTLFEDEDLKPFSASIRTCVDDPDEEIAWTAIKSVRRILPDSEYVPLLLPKLKDHRTRVQRAAIQELANGPETSMPAIADCFSSPDVTNRIVATNVLLLLNPFRASQFGVVTNHLRPSIFEGYLRRMSGTNSPK